MGSLFFIYLKFIKMHFVYIIYSPSIGVYYKGYSLDPVKRLYQHNAGESRYTDRSNDWVLVYVCSYETKREALIEEKRIKKLNHVAIERLIQSDRNSLRCQSLEL